MKSEKILQTRISLKRSQQSSRPPTQDFPSFQLVSQMVPVVLLWYDKRLFLLYYISIRNCSAFFIIRAVRPRPSGLGYKAPTSP